MYGPMFCDEVDLRKICSFCTGNFYRKYYVIARAQNVTFSFPFDDIN